MDDIAAWLRELGFEQYESAFRENHIDRETLVGLNADDLRELGVTSLGHRKRLLSAIAELGRAQAGLSGQPRPAVPPSRPPSPSSRPERRQLTVMFVDLVGSTTLSAKLDPEDMRDVLAAYQNAVVQAVAPFEGHIAKFMGDGVLAYFGWPQAHEDEAERAVRAGLAIVEAVRGFGTRFGEDLAVRIGIATGIVVVGDLVGEGAAQEEAVVGETPNLAARLQQIAPQNAVVIAASTRRLLGRLFAFADLGPQAIRGLSAPVSAFRVLAEVATESRFEAFRREELGPLVGREHELALLLSRWEIAKGGEGQVVLLSGEAGIGKSRIIASLRERLRDEVHFRIGYSCSPHHMNTALWPVIVQLERAAGYAREEPPSLKLEKLEKLLRQVHEPAEDALPLLAEFVGLPQEGHHAAPGGSAQEKKARIFGVLLQQMEGLARQRPVLVILEDAHWLDPTSTELFTRMVDRIRRLPVLFVATLRPEAPPPWTEFPHSTLLSLNRLGRPAARALLERTAAGQALAPALIEAILARTEGVPLFVEELTKTVIESGLAKQTGDGSLELGSLPQLAIPTTLQDSLMARLDRLAPAREVAQIAACIGREFDEAIVAAAANMPEGKVTAALDQLCRAELIQRHGTPPRHAFSFKHALVRDAAYATLIKSRRQLLHAQVADAFERLQPDAVAGAPEIVAHHFIEGGMPGRAAPYLLAAGRLAKARHAIREATALSESCLQLLESCQADSRPALRTIERECLLLSGDLAGVDDDLDRANAFYERALALAETGVDRSVARNRIHRIRYAERNGARIAFYEHGSGSPAIVFINPIVYGLAIFQPILERLCQEFRVITIDCRGAGRSDPFTPPYTTFDHMEDLRAIIAAADAAPIVGVGISRGSNLLIQLAHAYPELVAKIVIVGTPLTSGLPDGRPLYNPEYMALRRDAYSRGDADALRDLQTRFIYSEPEAEELRRISGKRWAALSAETILSFYDPDPGLDVTPLLDKMTTPTLVAHGRADQLVNAAASEFIASRIPGAQLYLFEGRAHTPMFSATDEFCSVLRAFIRTGKVTAARGSAAPIPQRQPSRGPDEMRQG